MTYADLCAALYALTQQALAAGLTPDQVDTALTDEAAGVCNDADPQ